MSDRSDFQPTPPEPAGGGSLPDLLQRVQDQLLARVRGSLKAHRDYTTLRFADHRWQQLAPGVQACELRQDGQVRVSLWRLQAGAEVPWPAGAQALELLVARGGLQHRLDDTAQPQAVAAHDYLVCQQPQQLGGLHAVEPSLLYVRQLEAPPQALPALEAHWWDMAAAQAGLLKRRKWRGNGPGVQVLPLCGDTQVVSMLVRFEPGASVPDHSHALDEDCLVLEGEMFLGDMLLREGDYQLAPAGGGHFGETSDVGVVFFFHGALDPVLLS